MTLFEHRPYTDTEREELETLRSYFNVSRELLNARMDLGYSQEDVARRAQTTQARVSEVEGMTGNPRFDTLDRISRAVGLEVTLIRREKFTSILGSGTVLLANGITVIGESHNTQIAAMQTGVGHNNNFTLAA